MTRIKISAGILLSFVVLSIFTSLWVNRRCDELLSLTERVEEAYINEDAAAAELSAELESRWKEFRKGAAILLNNEKLTDPERLISRIVYLVGQHSPELQTVLEELRHLIRQLQHGEKPVLTSIL